MEIARKSIASIWLGPYAFATPIASATGFIMQADGAHFLVTNYHVISGRHPKTDKQLGAAVPNRILMALLSRASTNSELLWCYHSQRLLDDDGEPLWVVHPSAGRRFDVAVLPLSIPKHVLPIPYEAD